MTTLIPVWTGGELLPPRPSSGWDSYAWPDATFGRGECCDATDRRRTERNRHGRPKAVCQADRLRQQRHRAKLAKERDLAHLGWRQHP